MSTPEVRSTAAPAANDRLRSGLGVAAVLAATLCWATAGVIGVKADLPGLPLTFLRVLLVAAMFAVAMASQRLRLSWAAIRQATPAGAVFGLTAAMFFEAIRHTSVGIATIIAALTPVLALPVAMRFLGERPTWLGVACALGAVGGVVLFVAPGYRDASASPRGLVLATGSMLAWVVYLFITKRARSGIGTLEYMTAMNLTAAVILAPLVLLIDREALRPPASSWGWIILLAVLPGFLGHGLLTWAQPHVDLSVSSILLQGETIGAALAGVIFLGERIVLIQALGMILAVAALAVLARSTTRPRRRSPTAATATAAAAASNARLPGLHDEEPAAAPPS